MSQLQPRQGLEVVAGGAASVPSSSSIARPPADPRTGPRKLLANGLLAGAAGGLAASAWVHHLQPGVVAGIFLHAFEGALVGGLCDWFAVVKTYAKVEEGSTEVAKELGEWVGQELLGHDKLRQTIRDAFEDPRIKNRLGELVEGAFGSQQSAEALLRAWWTRLEPMVIEFVATYDLKKSDLASASELIRDDRLLNVVGRCAGAALVDLGRSPELRRALDAALSDQGLKEHFVVGVADVPKRVTDLGWRLLEDAQAAASTGAIAPAVVTALRRFATMYVNSWNELGHDARMEAAKLLVDHLREAAIGAVARLAVQEHERLKRIEVLREHPAAGAILSLVGDVVNERFSRTIGSLVSSQLAGLRPAELRGLIQAKADPHLTMIRVNGTGLGFLVGGALGILLNLH